MKRIKLFFDRRKKADGVGGIGTVEACVHLDNGARKSQNAADSLFRKSDMF